MKHAGLLAHSSEGAALAFLTFCQEGFRRAGRHEHPDVTLDCTEIPLLVTPQNAPLPTLDSTRLLARAAYDVAADRRAMPAWRGGPGAQQTHSGG